MFQGQSVRVSRMECVGVFEVCFDRQGESINKFDARTVDELRQVAQLLRAQSPLRGILVTSAKDVFIVGADITEFGAMFAQPAEAIAADVWQSNLAFLAFEDLPAPSVVAINGFALGGGLEFALATSIRVMSEQAQIGVPEVKLGLFPGFGGTVRMMRVAGPAVACGWVASGKPAGAAQALEAGVVDAVVPADRLRAEALAWLERAMAGETDWVARQERKRRPQSQGGATLEQAFEQARSAAAKATPPHQPAALAALDMMREGAALDRDAAIRLEGQAFGRIARTQAAASMVQTFLNEQAVKKAARVAGKPGAHTRRAVVLGAGIMGGGIAFATALRGIPVRMKDVQQKALDAGMAEVAKQLERQVQSGRLTVARAAEVLTSITPQLGDEGLGEADLVIEAIVEKLEVKRQVLAALEPLLAPTAILASNTSSLRIDDIASALARPERLVGLHFFNPVPVMPLVEVVRGAQSSDAAVAGAVAYVNTIGKTAVVVRDCPGFLVNRVLTAYMRAFLQLVADGAAYTRVDQAMEAFGWPMGPAYLEDVVGMDTGSHVNDVISAGYPERMPRIEHDALRLMAQEHRYGQKSGLGFYRYEPNSRGKPVRSASGDTHALLERVQPQGPRDFTAEQIVDRMMLPMVLEAARALHEGVVASAAEVDLAMHLGLGFPAYAGGPLKYADWLGLPELLARCERLRALGPAYAPTDALRAMAAEGRRFY
ncbi:fatty acid oxidation complex subunit alpha FadB [Pseudorhodoferax sp. LjRoot39]|uniref:fatty acid oxidation complex subunit alpha FadB n=1 Tax=Pseudorhodoferax sp. LjRoot39 TaxID=3342328 RepID=UPI003ED052D0